MSKTFILSTLNIVKEIKEFSTPLLQETALVLSEEVSKQVQLLLTKDVTSDDLRDILSSIEALPAVHSELKQSILPSLYHHLGLSEYQAGPSRWLSALKVLRQFTEENPGDPNTQAVFNIINRIITAPVAEIREYEINRLYQECSTESVDHAERFNALTNVLQYFNGAEYILLNPAIVALQLPLTISWAKTGYQFNTNNVAHIKTILDCCSQLARIYPESLDLVELIKTGLEFCANQTNLNQWQREIINQQMHHWQERYSRVCNHFSESSALSHAETKPQEIKPTASLSTSTGPASVLTVRKPLNLPFTLKADKKADEALETINIAALDKYSLGVVAKRNLKEGEVFVYDGDRYKISSLTQKQKNAFNPTYLLVTPEYYIDASKRGNVIRNINTTNIPNYNAKFNVDSDRVTIIRPIRKNEPILAFYGELYYQNENSLDKLLSLTPYDTDETSADIFSKHRKAYQEIPVTEEMRAFFGFQPNTKVYRPMKMNSTKDELNYPGLFLIETESNGKVVEDPKQARVTLLMWLLLCNAKSAEPELNQINDFNFNMFRNICSRHGVSAINCLWHFYQPSECLSMLKKFLISDKDKGVISKRLLLDKFDKGQTLLHLAIENNWPDIFNMIMDRLFYWGEDGFASDFTKPEDWIECRYRNLAFTFFIAKNSENLDPFLYAIKTGKIAFLNLFFERFALYHEKKPLNQQPFSEFYDDEKGSHENENLLKNVFKHTDIATLKFVINKMNEHNKTMGFGRVRRFAHNALKKVLQPIDFNHFMQKINVDEIAFSKAKNNQRFFVEQKGQSGNTKTMAIKSNRKRKR